MNYFTGFLKRMVTALTIAGACFMAGIMLVVVANIVSRVFNVPILGTYEIVELGAVPMVAFALGYCALTQSNVVMDIILTRLPHPVRTVLTVITTFLSLGIWVLIAWQSAKSAIQQHLVGEITIIMKWPIYPMRYVFVLGAIVLCLVLLLDLSKALREVGK